VRHAAQLGQVIFAVFGPWFFRPQDAEVSQRICDIPGGSARLDQTR
jgi:hypothetical protein